MMCPARWQPWLAVLLWLALALPPTRRTMEANMSAHMLLQLPLLALCGGWMTRALSDHPTQALAAWNRSGISGLLLASLTSLYWMLPRALDHAIEDPWFELAKFLTVPLLIGAAVALSWPRASFVVRGLILAETIATAFRGGWLYLAAPKQLCANYLLAEQQRLGRYFVAAGVAILLVLAWVLIFGQVRTNEATRERQKSSRTPTAPA